VGGMPDDGLDASGHMTPPTVSAYDPIFWLHHCAVDRFLVLSSLGIRELMVGVVGEY
jgi:hypothetical protein